MSAEVGIEGCINRCGVSFCDIWSTTQTDLENTYIKRQNCLSPLSKTIAAICILMAAVTILTYCIGTVSESYTLIFINISAVGLVIALHIIFTLSHARETAQNLQSKITRIQTSDETK